MRLSANDLANDLKMSEHTERIFHWGSEGQIVAIWTPPATPAKTTVLVLLNAGVIHHIGAHRLHVKLARALAGLGYGSLRFDFSGSGDSGLPAGVFNFQQQAQRDLQDVLQGLASELNVDRFALLGICSGAAHAQASAVGDARVKGVFLVDGFMYPSWRGRWAFARRMAQTYGHATFFKRLARLALKRLRRSFDARAERQALFVEDSTPTRSVHDFAADMQVLSDRDVGVTLMFTGSVLEHFGHARQLRDVFPGQAWLEHVRCIFEPSVDHTLTLRAAQMQLLEHVVHWLASLPDADQGMR